MTARLIAIAASACDADLIVIGGTRGKSPLRAVLRGAVSHDLVHRTDVPVMLVP